MFSNCGGEIPRRGVAGSYGNSILNSLKKVHTVFQGIVLVSTPASSEREFLFLLLLVSLIMAILPGVRWYLILCSLDLLFSNSL